MAEQRQEATLLSHWISINERSDLLLLASLEPVSAIPLTASTPELTVFLLYECKPQQVAWHTNGLPTLQPPLLDR